MQTKVEKQYSRLAPAELAEVLEDRTSYGKTFFVPKRARWHEEFIDENGAKQLALKNLQTDIGEMLNKALAALEAENEPLRGILTHINFKAEVNNRPKLKYSDLKDLLDHFGTVVIVNENFDYPPQTCR